MFPEQGIGAIANTVAFGDVVGQRVVASQITDAQLLGD